MNLGSMPGLEHREAPACLISGHTANRLCDRDTAKELAALGRAVGVSLARSAGRAVGVSR